MIRVMEADISLDLRPMLKHLYARRIHCQVTEESGKQVIWVRSQEEAELVTELMAEWQSAGYGTIPDAAIEAEEQAGQAIFPARDMSNGLLRAVWEAPLTLALIAACALVALISEGGNSLRPVAGLFYPGFVPGAGQSILTLLGQIDSPGLALRTLTPALLHFGVIHLVFNMLWLWYLGRMIEQTLPLWAYALLIVFLAFVGNTAQFLISWQNNFGGMSGVVYGLLGFIGSWQLLNPGHRLQLPRAMIGVFIAALVLMEVFASSWIASAAHAGGLAAGVLAGLVAGLLYRTQSKQI